jgi:hypothetical protein
MKRATRIFALTLTLLPMLAAAQLGSNGHLVAHVPFQFRAGEKLIPAGDCVVEEMARGSALVVRNVAARTSVLTLAEPETPKADTGAYALVFHRYGDRYFLTAIEQGGRMIDSLPESSGEKEMRAQNVPAAEEVLLASLK